MSVWVNGLAKWEWIAHLTFRYEASLWSAQRQMEKFWVDVAEGLSWFYAIEQNPSRDGHHIHALIANPRELRRRAIWKAWFERYGRNRIEPVRSLDDVSCYCAKYVCKERAWWDVHLDPTAHHLARARAGAGSPVDHQRSEELQLIALE